MVEVDDGVYAVMKPFRPALVLFLAGQFFSSFSSKWTRFVSESHRVPLSLPYVLVATPP